MNPPERPLTLMREEAAIRQIEAAIAAFERGLFDVAITLAGAAEGMFDYRKDGTIFDSMLVNPIAQERFSRKEWISILNMERDWLKHSSNKVEPVTFDIDSTAYMIARAASKMPSWTTAMKDFKTWYMVRISQMLESDGVSRTARPVIADDID
ncbi:hypothetical protein [Xanthobacter autotrophicus]|uniref:hypothetical protein n=1 Tax=Xanthobacter autotrophicus TaxID=280 RepID=UPI00372677E9